MTPEALAEAIKSALEQAVALAELPSSTVVPDQVRVERPKNRDHGDWSTNVAMQLAKSAGIPPREVAVALAQRLIAHAGVAKADIAGPGFLNITLDAASAGELAQAIIDAGTAYGTSATESGRIVNLEYISANPTGPLHLGHTRWAALGDSMVRILRAAGAKVTAEYYVNDAGAQMTKFARSVQAAVKGEPTPEGGYPGAYIHELAKQVVAAHPQLSETTDEAQLPVIRDAAYRLQLREIQTTLERFRVQFDVWRSEAELHDSGAVKNAIDRLRSQGHVYDKDNATWLRTTDFGDDKDRVLCRSNGELTYFASDAAYYLDKKDRGFTEKIYLLGADHHGYVGRLKAIVACAGDDPDHNIQVKIGQLVNLNGAKLSKRAGNIVELNDLIDWIGTDAVRYSLSRYPADSPLSLDGEELRKQTNENPVYYVQYAHSRMCRVSRLAGEDGIRREDGFVPSLLTDPTEAELLAALADYPRVVAQAAHLLEPHRVARYLEDLATKSHKWYDSCRVRPINDEEAITDLHRTRLWLNDATRVVLANGLGLLGVTAPEQM